MRTFLLLLYSIVLLIGLNSTKAMELNLEKVESIKKNLSISFPDELKSKENIFLNGFGDGLLNFDQLNVTQEQIQNHLPHYILGSIRNWMAKISYTSGKYAAYQMVYITNLRHEKGGAVLTFDEATLIWDQFDTMEKKVMSLIDQHFQNADFPNEFNNESLNDIKVNIKEKIKKLNYTDKRSLIDPFYVNSPNDVNSFHISSVIEEFENKLALLFDFSLSGRELSREIKNSFFPDHREIKSHDVILRLMQIYEVYRNASMNNIPRSNIAFNKNRQEQTSYAFKKMRSIEKHKINFTDPKEKKAFISTMDQLIKRRILEDQQLWVGKIK